MKAHVTDYLLYRWRYVIGYSLITLTVVGILALSALYVPGALRTAEMNSALASGALSIESIDPMSVVNLPYHILQRVCFVVFGVTTLSIKLPSIILGALTAVGIFLLLKSWFRRNVAVLGTVLAVTTTQFLFLIQDGTPAITFSFVTIWLLTVCTYITRQQIFSTLWKVVACVLMATALYVPLGIYVDIALIVTMSFHPHIRYIIRRIPRMKLVIAVILGLVSVAPLVYAAILNPQVIFALLGAQSGSIDIKQNLITNTLNLFGFFSASGSAMLRPIYSLGVMMLIAIGIYKLLTVKYTARSYAVIILAVFIITAMVMDPANDTSLFPLATVMIAMGIATLIVNWYKLFPRNPYARIAGLIPLTIFALGVVFSGVIRYMDNYTYNASVLTHYSNDLRLIDRELHTLRSTAGNTRLIVSADELPFYNLVAHYDKRFAATTDATNAPINAIVTHDAYKKTKLSGATLKRIITSRKANDADRLYVYSIAVK